MDDAPSILTPRQLPTPADSPVQTIFRHDPEDFRLPQTTRIPQRDLQSGPDRSQREEHSEREEERGRFSTSSRRGSFASTSSNSIWSNGDRFIPGRRSSSSTSFNLLPPLATGSSPLPRSHSAPVQARVFSGYSAYEVAKSKEFSSVIRSELLGPSFAPEIPEIPTTDRRHPPSKDRRKSNRQPSSITISRHPYPPSPRASPPVLSFSSSITHSPASKSYDSSASPLSQAYRLSPFNPTTDRFLSSPVKVPRQICLTPCRVLDAPLLSDNFYESGLDWSSSNHLLAVALGGEVYTWSSNGAVTKIVNPDELERSTKVTSVKWIPKGDQVAIGRGEGSVSIYDARTSQKLRQLQPHSGRVGVLAPSPSSSSSSYSPQILSSGSADRLIFQRDLRMRDEVVRVLKGFKGEITSLEWNEDGELACGGNDNSIRLFKGFDEKPFLKLRKAHSAAIKALAWSPHQRSLLATGGGTEDQKLKFWNTRTGELLREIETGSQVCQIVWSKTTNELVSTHGYSARIETDNCVHVWSYNKFANYAAPYNPIATLASGRGRMLHAALSPDSRYIVCGSSDEVLRFWDIFPPTSTSTNTSASNRPTRFSTTTSPSASLDLFSSIR